MTAINDCHFGRLLVHPVSPVDNIAWVNVFTRLNVPKRANSWRRSCGNPFVSRILCGIRRGTDVLKALALGAQAVLIGRPYLFGLSAGGAEGVTRVVNILRREFEMAMALTGRTTIKDIDASVLWSSPQEKKG